MSEYINNREYRQQVLRELITELHSGVPVEEVKPRFAELIQGISATEISEMEQALMNEGMPAEEIQRLCDVHAAVFKGSIAEIHGVPATAVPGHPIQTFKSENRAIERLIGDIRGMIAGLRAGADGNAADARKGLTGAFERLWEVDKHYSRKENLLFPYMEKYGITAPPKVMWGVDDEIRDAIKGVRALLAKGGDPGETADMAEAAVERVLGMIPKEEDILFPMVIETLSEDEWIEILRASDEIGYCLVEPGTDWKPVREDIERKALAQAGAPSNDGYVTFDAGVLLPAEINAMLNTLPLDITFVDAEGSVKYFTQGKERIFARPKTILGRKVQNCHPPGSVHIVEKIVEDLMAGKKDHEDFWIRMGDKFVYIRYFAVRDPEGKYLGTVEVTQDIAPIQGITGEKRLLSE